MKAFVNLENGSNLTDVSPILTDVSPILTCINTLNESVVWNEDRSKYVKSLSLKQLKQETQVSEDDGFGFAISLRDGSCLYTSKSMSKHLGYPQDMLDKQCFMNFLYHKDHITFAHHLSQGLNACFIQEKRDDSHLAVNTFFCRMRMYQSLKDGYNMTDRKTMYKSFHINLHISELIVDDMCVEDLSGTLCVNATATVVKPAYSVPEEIPAMTSFSTRHTASCHFSHVDASAIPYIGYLPQDLIGLSVFDFYHTEDMPQLKDIYELVVKERGSSFRSKPYRFRIQNGCYIMLETEWSCFINPWTHKLEFVVGQHRVLKGPSDVDIFTPAEKHENYFPEEILKESQKIQKEIKGLLSEPIIILQAKKSKRFCNKRKRDLINFVYNSIAYNDEDGEGNEQKAKENQFEEKEDLVSSDSDSVVMGDISPYRDVNDSSFSSETPPTVQHLRLQENIDRFFASEPKTYSSGSDDSNKIEKISRGDNSHSQVSSSGSGNGSGSGGSGSGNGSGNTSASRCEQPSQNGSNENNQQKGSYFSNFSDSGYGKSKNDGPGTSQEGSTINPMMWPNDNQNNNEKFSSSLALTEKSLSAHNRFNYKHFKQQRKGKQTLTNARDNWFQQMDGSKQKKTTHGQSVKVSTLDRVTQTEEKYTSNSKRNAQPSSENAPGVANPFSMFAPMNTSMPMPTPFFIPVMYMGSMPYFPGTSQANWPFGPPPTPTTEAPKTDQSGERTGYSSYAEPQRQSANTRQEDFRAPPAPSKTTVAPGGKFTDAFQNAGKKYKDQNMDYGKVVENFTDAVDSRKQNLKSESGGSSCSFFTRSSSFQTDKDEDMDCEKDKPTPPRPSSSKIELTSEVAFRYQMNLPNLEDTLMKDREVLKSMAQPELVNEQLLLLQDERQEENSCKINMGEGEFNVTEAMMMGLVTEDCVNDELEKREEQLLHLMCED